MLQLFKDNPVVAFGGVAFAVIFIAWIFQIGSFAPRYDHEESMLAYAKKNGFRYMEPVSFLPSEHLHLNGVNIPRSGIKIAFKDGLVIRGLTTDCIILFTDPNSAEIGFERKRPEDIEVWTRPRDAIGLIYISKQPGHWGCRFNKTMTLN